MCTIYTFYFWLLPFLCATSYITVNSVKRLCFSACTSSFDYLFVSSSLVWIFIFTDEFDRA